MSSDSVSFIEPFQNKMSMGGSASTCKISMLWNWYTIDTCFLANSWKCDTKAKFAGSCVGCFALVVAAQWLNRISRQFDIELVKRHKLKYLAYHYTTNSSIFSSSDDITSELSQQGLEQIGNESMWRTTLIALSNTISHTWYFNFLKREVNRPGASLEKTLLCCTSAPAYEVYPSVLDHICRVSIFVLQWGLSYIIMLLFMYYNGYIIFSCLIGAAVGRFLFNYEPLGTCGSASSSLDNSVAHDKEENDRKCCM